MEEMIATSSATKKKEISWEDPNYLDKVHVRDMGVRSQVLLLEGKTSVGPCFRDLAPNVGPSGILICVPKKHSKCEKADFNPIPSVVNINVSKKNISLKKSQINHPEKAKSTMEQNDPKGESKPGTFFGGVRLKLENLTCKFINAFGT